MRNILLILPLFLIGAVGAEPPGESPDVDCGSMGPAHVVTGQEHVIGTYATQAEAMAAATNVTLMHHHFLQIGWGQITEFCEPCIDNDGCFPTLVYDETVTFAVKIGQNAAGQWMVAIWFDNAQSFSLLCSVCWWNVGFVSQNDP